MEMFIELLHRFWLLMVSIELNMEMIIEISIDFGS